MRAPAKVISSCVDRDADDVAGRAAGLGDEPRRLEGDEAAEPVVERARDEAAVRVLERLARDHGDVADADQRARLVAVLRADVDVQVAQLGHLLALLVAQQVDRLLAHHARHDAAARGDLDALADEDHRVPAADAAEPEEAVVVDVADDQADLVDVADHGEQRAVRGALRRARRVEPTVSCVTSANAARRLAENGGGGLLVAGRPGRGQQLAEDVGDAACERGRARRRARQPRPRASNWRSTNGRMPPCWKYSPLSGCRSARAP